ncbi:hypothetical protein BC828DRAFT_372079 [Blastocladiella britannica]|nr:hypothetical protein BC828DRAFT_372079 [Blastocladiella britannica]
MATNQRRRSPPSLGGMTSASTITPLTSASYSYPSSQLGTASVPGTRSSNSGTNAMRSTLSVLSASSLSHSARILTDPITVLGLSSSHLQVASSNNVPGSWDAAAPDSTTDSSSILFPWRRSSRTVDSVVPPPPAPVMAHSDSNGQSLLSSSSSSSATHAGNDDDLSDDSLSALLPPLYPRPTADAVAAHLAAMGYADVPSDMLDALVHDLAADASQVTSHIDDDGTEDGHVPTAAAAATAAVGTTGWSEPLPALPSDDASLPIADHWPARVPGHRHRKSARVTLSNHDLDPHDDPHDGGGWHDPSILHDDNNPVAHEDMYQDPSHPPLRRADFEAVLADLGYAPTEISSDAVDELMRALEQSGMLAEEPLSSPSADGDHYQYREDHDEEEQHDHSYPHHPNNGKGAPAWWERSSDPGVSGRSATSRSRPGTFVYFRIVLLKAHHRKYTATARPFQPAYHPPPKRRVLDPVDRYHAYKRAWEASPFLVRRSLPPSQSGSLWAMSATNSNLSATTSGGRSMASPFSSTTYPRTR